MRATSVLELAKEIINRLTLIEIDSPVVVVSIFFNQRGRWLHFYHRQRVGSLVCAAIFSISVL